MDENLKKAMDLFNNGTRNTEVWVPCTEENYPDYDDCKKCAVKYQDNYGNWWYHIYYTCPLGWTALIKMGAYCKMLD